MTDPAKRKRFMAIDATPYVISYWLYKNCKRGVDFRGSTKGRMAEAYASGATYARSGQKPVIDDDIVSQLEARYGIKQPTRKR